MRRKNERCALLYCMLRSASAGVAGVNVIPARRRDAIRARIVLCVCLSNVIRAQIMECIILYAYNSKIHISRVTWLNITYW